jgi:hypothetical protein
MANILLYEEDIKKAIKDYIVNTYFIDIGTQDICTRDIEVYGQIKIDLDKEDVKILK